MKKLLFFIPFVCVLAAADVDIREYASPKLGKRVESIVWNVSYSYNARDTRSPRALLVGDSVCRGYHGLVRTALGNKVNISYLATSNCITDPLFLPVLELMFAREKYDIVIFNNGLHSLSTDRKMWKESFSKALDYIAKRLPGTVIVVLNSTPKRDGDKKVDEINALTAEVAKAKNLPLADIHALCKDWNKKEWRDNYHFSKKAIKKQAEFVSSVILKHIKRTADGIVQAGSETGPDGKIK
ncbi:MAG: SGNH/GDSL hydrolase family protein [Lentisphaeria bacterium]|nr:SGNH/GDSL hydrolase family protein [Lentisphaeria bacterium]